MHDMRCDTRTWKAVAGTALVLCTGACGGLRLEDERRRDLDVAPIETALVRIEAEGLAPASTVRLVEGEGGVAFVNDLTASDAEVVFTGIHGAGMACSFTSGFTRDAARGTTGASLRPGAVASLCIHEAGRFPFVVRAPGAPSREGLVVAREVDHGASGGRP